MSSYYSSENAISAKVKKLIEERGSKPEYLDYRCCMCPHIGIDESVDICPADSYRKGYTPCRFVKYYSDEDNMTYAVFQENKTYIINRRDEIFTDAFDRAPGFEVFNSFDDAQSTLNKYAKSLNWHEYIRRCKVCGCTYFNPFPKIDTFAPWSFFDLCTYCEADSY